MFIQWLVTMLGGTPYVLMGFFTTAFDAHMGAK